MRITTHQHCSNPLDQPALRSMFEARKRVFVDLLRWDVPVIDGRFELDQFDTPDARYVLLTDRAGGHQASARLLPTDRPHILSALFPELCAGAIPAGPRVAEITRFCLDRRLSAAARRGARNRLVSALVRDALRNGIATYTGVANMQWLQQILAFGWRCRPLGLPGIIGPSVLGALAIEIDLDTPALLAANGIWVDDLDQALLSEAA